MIIKQPKNFYPGLIFSLVGLGFVVLSPRYSIGTAAKMGPGYFPLVMGGLQFLLGVILAGKGLFAEQPRTTGEGLSFRVKPLALVLFSLVLFGLLLKPLGLIGATFVLVMFSSLASEEFRFWQAFGNSLVILTIILVIFVYFLELPLPVRPDW
ncbi:MAG: tripartite tricarboxylate transporter TctB family protein [Thermodesulfobacteriota bacterium]